MNLRLSHPLSKAELGLKGVEITVINGPHVELKVTGNIPNLLKQLSLLPIEDMSFQEAALEDTFMEFYKEKA